MLEHHGSWLCRDSAPLVDWQKSAPPQKKQENPHCPTTFSHHWTARMQRTTQILFNDLLRKPHNTNSFVTTQPIKLRTQVGRWVGLKGVWTKGRGGGGLHINPKTIIAEHTTQHQICQFKVQNCVGASVHSFLYIPQMCGGGPHMTGPCSRTGMYSMRVISKQACHSRLDWGTGTVPLLLSVGSPARPRDTLSIADVDEAHNTESLGQALASITPFENVCCVGVGAAVLPPRGAGGVFVSHKQGVP